MESDKTVQQIAQVSWMAGFEAALNRVEGEADSTSPQEIKAEAEEFSKGALKLYTQLQVASKSRVSA